MRPTILSTLVLLPLFSLPLLDEAPHQFRERVDAELLPGSQGMYDEEERFDAWVAFTDKGLSNDAERRAAFRALEEGFDPRALERRRRLRTLPGLFDDHDLPLAPPYVAAVSATGAQVRVQSRWMNGVTILATRSQLEAVHELTCVREVRDIHPYVPRGERTGRIPRDPDLRRGRPPAGDPLYGWSGDQIRQLQLHRLHAAGFRGEGVRIGVVDTGFLLHQTALDRPSRPLRVSAQWDFMDNDSTATPEPGDSPVQHEHGALVLGALASDLPGVLVGSAPDADYILLKAEDEATEYFLEERWFVAALEFAEAHGADIVTSSVVLFNGYDPEDVDGQTSVMAQGWGLATGNGVIGFQGGGNSGHDTDPATHHLLPPAGVHDVITVGAATLEGAPAPFSSDGLRVGTTVKPELLALGMGVATISPYEAGAYTASGGSSMATPLLAGGVACLLQAHPDWTAEQIREALFRSASYRRAHGEPDPLFTQGYGVPDLAMAAGLDPLQAGSSWSGRP
jgi:subtilisin family serine protease